MEDHTFLSDLHNVEWSLLTLAQIMWYNIMLCCHTEVSKALTLLVVYNKIANHIHYQYSIYHMAQKFYGLSLNCLDKKLTDLFYGSPVSCFILMQYLVDFQPLYGL